MNSNPEIFFLRLNAHARGQTVKLVDVNMHINCRKRFVLLDIGLSLLQLGLKHSLLGVELVRSLAKLKDLTTAWTSHNVK